MAFIPSLNITPLVIGGRSAHVFLGAPPVDGSIGADVFTIGSLSLTSVFDSGLGGEKTTSEIAPVVAPSRIVARGKGMLGSVVVDGATVGVDLQIGGS